MLDKYMIGGFKGRLMMCWPSGDIVLTDNLRARNVHEGRDRRAGWRIGPRRRTSGPAIRKPRLIRYESRG